jgi:hypothetical protein
VLVEPHPSSRTSRHKERTGPRSLRFQLAPGKAPVLVRVSKTSADRRVTGAMIWRWHVVC